MRTGRLHGDRLDIRSLDDLHQLLATAQDMLMETAIDAGDLHALIKAVQAERAE